MGFRPHPLDPPARIGFADPMRIIGGEFRRKRLFSPTERMPTRPIPDMVKEALFNLLRGHVEGQECYDGFAGSGAIGLEAISRGARRCVFIERDKDVIEVLKKNIEHCGAGDRAEAVRADALGSVALARCPQPVHLIFFDPPYKLVEDPETYPRVIEQLGRLIRNLDADGYAMLRTPNPMQHVVGSTETDGQVRSIYAPVDLKIPGALGPETHAYGSTAVHLYMRDPASSASSGSSDA